MYITSDSIVGLFDIKYNQEKRMDLNLTNSYFVLCLDSCYKTISRGFSEQPKYQTLLLIQPGFKIMVPKMKN